MEAAHLPQLGIDWEKLMDGRNPVIVVNGNNNTITNLSDCFSFPEKLYSFPETNQCFYGRKYIFEQILEAIEERRNETHSFNRTIVLHGFSGMGKSETIQAFAKKFQKNFDHIVWIDAQTEGSLTASFKKLAKELKIPFETIADLPKLQNQLANFYQNGIFIFDNAVRLKTTDGQFGIENYLLQEDKFIPNKPIFIVTSRNGKLDWGGFASNIKMIHMDRLRNKEATKVLKKCLHIEDREISNSLEKSIYSLVTTLGGYPLGLSLVGSAIDAEELLLEDIENRVKTYNEILKDVDLQEIPNEWTYEAALGLIYEETKKKITMQREGHIAFELLNIIVCMDSPALDVSWIYSGTFRDWSGRQLSSSPDVQMGIKILKDYSIVQLDNESLKLHRLVKQYARKSLNPHGALIKITRFFSFYENTSYLPPQHVATVFRAINTLLGDPIISLENDFRGPASSHTFSFLANIFASFRGQNSPLLDPRDSCKRKTGQDIGGNAGNSQTNKKYKTATTAPSQKKYEPTTTEGKLLAEKLKALVNIVKLRNGYKGIPLKEIFEGYVTDLYEGTILSNTLATLLYDTKVIDEESSKLIMSNKDIEHNMCCQKMYDCLFRKRSVDHLIYVWEKTNNRGIIEGAKNWLDWKHPTV